MYFILSKILGFLAIPSNLLIMLGIVGALLLRTRLARAGRRLVIGSLILLAIAGFSPLGNVLILPLEQRFPAWNGAGGEPAGIVILGGAVTPDVTFARNAVALNEAAERITAAVELARRYPNARVIFSGGEGGLIYRGNESEAALRLFERLGLPPGRIATEDRSRNTLENALFTKQIAMPKPGERWLLVTSAYHLPRAVGVFRKIGFAVEAYPVDWRTRGIQDVLRPFPTVGEGLRRTDTAVREWSGLALHWLLGNTSELFPGPAGG
jgi:uncharacterized SAM-binding protein YcdF (DUF218 family)